MSNSLRRLLPRLAGAVCTFAATTHAAELVPSPDADTKFQAIERSIFLYDQRPYTIAEAVDKNDVAGLSVVLIHDGKPAVHRTYGYRVERKKERATDQTIYQCASMSKLVSSLGVVTAARLGEVRLDQPVTEFSSTHENTLVARWADQYFAGERASWAKDITLRRLLSHSAGLDVHGISAAPWLRSKDPLENILFGKSVFRAPVKPLDEPGLTYRYSGGGYTAAEAWLEGATGQKFKDYLKQRVLDPLGMTQSTYETGSEDTPNLAWGCSHGICLYGVRTLDVKAAGGLLCHPVDYARLVALMMNDGKEYLLRGVGERRIPTSDIATLLTPSKRKDDGKLIRDGNGLGLGLGVKLSLTLQADGLPRAFSHGGIHQGFANYFYADREKKAGLVVMVNGALAWSRQREEYGAETLQGAVLQAFLVAYGIAPSDGPLAPRCSADTDCLEGHYCNAGVDFVHNSCKPLKSDNASCELLGGGHQCKSGHCKSSHCFTPNSVPMGGVCYVDDACQDGVCSSVVPGTKGTCVCRNDDECGPDKWCNRGADTTKNRCELLKSDNASCELLGGGHQCKSGHCKSSHCFTPNSVPMGGVCYVDDACQDGACSSIVPGTKGICVCNDDHGCGPGKWCNRGADTTKNRCELLKSDNASCDLVGGGHQCQSGHCAFAHCYTPGSVPLGGTCYLDAACDKGKCSSVVPGTQGNCVCESDGDCGSGWCDRGIDGRPNACRAKLPKGAVCGTVGEIGVGHRCQSGECKVAGFSTKLECK